MVVIPKVSIIVPVYKSEQSLRRCVDSILNQSFSDFELILIDDGSPDDCGKICDDYTEMDSRVKVIHKDNGGVSSARNAGIQLSVGEYMCFIDSDDDIKKEFVSELIDLYNYDVELAVCGYNWVEGDRVIRETKFSENEYDFLHREDVFKLNEKVMMSAPWCKLYKSQIVKDNNIFFEKDLSLGEDLVFNFSYLSFITDIAVINKQLYNYRVDNENSLLRKYRKDLLDNTIKMNCYVYDIIQKWDLDRDILQSFYNSVYWGFDNVLVNTFSKNNTDSFKNKIKFNREILKSIEFKKAVKAYSGHIGFVNKLVYVTHCYLLRLVYERIIKFIKG